MWDFHFIAPIFALFIWAANRHVNVGYDLHNGTIGPVWAVFCRFKIWIGTLCFGVGILYDTLYKIPLEINAERILSGHQGYYHYYEVPYSLPWYCMWVWALLWVIYIIIKLIK